MRDAGSTETKRIRWFKSFSFYGLVILAFIPIWDMLGITIIMQTIGRKLVVEQTSRLMEETGNNAITRIQRRSHQIEALARDLASIGETLPKDRTLFMTVVPRVLNFQGDPGVAGGGIWPEPYAFSPAVMRHSFFYGRAPSGELRFYDDYNHGRGYHNDEWYPVVKYSAPHKCFWSRSYTDPYSLQPMVTCSVAIREADQFRGVATVDLKLEGLHAFIEEIRQKTGGYLFLADRNNRFITFPEENLIRRERTDQAGNRIVENIATHDLAREKPEFKVVADELDSLNRRIVEMASASNPRIEELTRSIDSASDQIDETDARMIASIISDPLRNEKTHLVLERNLAFDFVTREPSLLFVFNVPESYWKLIIVKPLSEAQAAASTITQIILGLIFCTILAGGLFVVALIRKFVSAPVNETLADIRSVVRKVKAEEYYSLVENPVRYASENELGELADQVNTLSNEVKRKYLSLLALNESLEAMVEERTRALASTLSDVRAMKLEQDGDYYLTSELIKPLAANMVQSERVKLDFIVRQKKQFEFKKWKEEIGGDICIAHTIHLRGRPFTLFLNADAMGKSLQGAAGALVIGSIFEASVERTKNASQVQDQSPERWIKNSFLEIHKVFESFTGSMLVSLVLGLLDDDTGTLYTINADHPPMVLYRNGRAAFLTRESALLKVGMLRLDGRVRVQVLKLEPGDVLFAGSDGKDDIATARDLLGNPVIQDDETIFLKHVENAEGDLQRLIAELQRAGEWTDDLSLLRLEFVQVPRPLARVNTASFRDSITALLRARDRDRAAAIAAQYVQKHPWDSGALFWAARAMQRIGYLEGAVDCSERLRIREPEFQRNLSFLRKLHLALGNNRRAEEIAMDLELLRKTTH
jgi:HAMP domain-containing protein